MALIHLLNGPNLNQLGRREPAIYGSCTLEEINRSLRVEASALGHDLLCRQTQAEHEFIGFIEEAATLGVQALIINAAAWSHTSIAIRDALICANIPFHEVHLSNIYQRESFRQQLLCSDLAEGIIVGCGAYGYHMALMAIHHTQTR